MVANNDLLDAIQKKDDADVVVTIGAGDIDKYVHGIKNILMEKSREA